MPKIETRQSVFSLDSEPQRRGQQSSVIRNCIQKTALLSAHHMHLPLSILISSALCSHTLPDTSEGGQHIMVHYGESRMSTSLAKAL